MFFIEDNINRGWKLVVHANARSQRIFYKRDPQIAEESEEEDGADGAQVAGQNDSTAPRREGALIAVEADDAAGEDPNNDDSDSGGDEEPGSASNDLLESDEEEEEAARCWPVIRSIPDLEAHEVLELESDGEFDSDEEPYAS